MKKLFLITLLLGCFFAKSQITTTKMDTIPYYNIIHCDSLVYFNDTDTINCLLLVSDTNKPKEVFYIDGYVVLYFDYSGVESYLDNKRNPLPKNIVVWNHNCLVE